MSNQIGSIIFHSSKYSLSGIPSIPGKHPLLVNLTAVCSSSKVIGASSSLDPLSDSVGKFSLSKNKLNNSSENLSSGKYRVSKNDLNVFLI